MKDPKKIQRKKMGIYEYNNKGGAIVRSTNPKRFGSESGQRCKDIYYYSSIIIISPSYKVLYAVKIIETVMIMTKTPKILT